MLMNGGSPPPISATPCRSCSPGVPPAAATPTCRAVNHATHPANAGQQGPTPVRQQPCYPSLGAAAAARLSGGAPPRPLPPPGSVCPCNPTRLGSALECHRICILCGSAHQTLHKKVRPRKHPKGWVKPSPQQLEQSGSHLIAKHGIFLVIFHGIRLLILFAESFPDLTMLRCIFFGEFLIWRPSRSLP